MYYVYLIKVMVASLAIVISINYVIYILIRQRDKAIYIKGYEQNNKVGFVIVDIIYRIFFYISLVLFLPVLIYYLAACKVQRKKLRVVFEVLLINPVIAIIVPYLLYVKIDFFLMANNLFGMSNFIYYWRHIWLWISVPFFIILLFRQYRKLIAAENQILFEYANEQKFEYDESKTRKKNQAWLQLKRDEEFNEKYLKIYDNVAQWHKDKFNIINYRVFYKLLIIYSSVILMITNIFIAIIYFDILDNPYAISPTNYKIMSSPLGGDQYFFFYVYFTVIGLIILASVYTTYITNSNIVLIKKSYLDYSLYISFGKIKKRTIVNKNSKIVIQLIIMIITIIAIAIAWQIYPYDNSRVYGHFSLANYRNASDYSSDINIPFDDNKKLVVEAVKNKYNYANYTREEKYGYVINNYSKFYDDLEELEFPHLPFSDSPTYSNRYNVTTTDNYFRRDWIIINVYFRQEFKSFFPEYNDKVYIFMSQDGIALTYDNFNESGVTYFWDPTLYYSDGNEDYLMDYSNDFTPEQVAVEELMIEKAFEFTDELFAMEMEDQGIVV